MSAKKIIPHNIQSAIIDDEPIRLSKLMAQQGLCSRREADVLIEQGLVQVEGKVLSQLGVKVFASSKISLLPAANRFLSAKLSIMLHKPAGYISSLPQGRQKQATDLLKQENFSGQNFSPVDLTKLVPAGRLDLPSRGLLILTQNGWLASQLISDGSDIEKEYIVKVRGHITKIALEKLHFGLHLDGIELRPATIEQVGKQEIRFVLQQGRKRQIRRMCKLVNLIVEDLQRTRIGNLSLGGLKEGQWRLINPNEVL